MFDSLWLYGLSPARLLCLWDFPGMNTGLSCHFLLQGIFLIEGLNSGLLHCRQILFHLSHQGGIANMSQSCPTKSASCVPPLLHCSEWVTGTVNEMGWVKRLSCFWKFCFVQSSKRRVIWGAQARGGWEWGPRGNEQAQRRWKKSESEVTQSCLTLCDPMDCSLPDSSIHGIFQARILERVAISFSRKSSRPRDWTRISCIIGRWFTIWATREGVGSQATEQTADPDEKGRSGEQWTRGGKHSQKKVREHT